MRSAWVEWTDLQIVRERARRWLEFVALFVGVPLAMAFAMEPRFFQPTLFALLVVGVGLLLLTRGFRWRRLLEGPVLPHWRLILFFTAGAVLTIFGAIYLIEATSGRSGLLFNLLRQRPELVAFISVAYPIFMVVPQEVMFRALFFERYGDLFGDKWAAIAVNSVVFGLAHLFYWNWPAVGLTFLANFFFAYAYVELRSFPLAWLLHSIGGVLIFSMGLGFYFYHGAIGG